MITEISDKRCKLCNFNPRKNKETLVGTYRATIHSVTIAFQGIFGNEVRSQTLVLHHPWCKKLEGDQYDN